MINSDIIYEAWTITSYKSNNSRLYPYPSIPSVTPLYYFDQKELFLIQKALQSQYASRKPWWILRRNNYTADLESRLRRLEALVQREIYQLITDRTKSTSNHFQFWQWRLVALVEVPGGIITEEPTLCQRRRGLPGKSTSPLTEYRLILHGRMLKHTSLPWTPFDRYTRNEIE